MEKNDSYHQMNIWMEQVNTSFSWNRFCDEIRHENRFFPHSDFLGFLDELYDNYRVLLSATENDTLYRARCIHTDNIKKIKADQRLEGFDKKDSGEPPTGKSFSGRANPAGVSSLYLASDIETACAEVQPVPSQLISVASFKLKADTTIIDLCKVKVQESTKYSQAEMNSAIRKVMFEFARPQDKENDIDYAVSQYIAAFFMQKGVQGIKYISSHNPVTGSFNLVLFDSTIAECTSEHGTVCRCIAEEKQYQILQSGLPDDRKTVNSRNIIGVLSDEDIEKIRRNILHFVKGK